MPRHQDGTGTGGQLPAGPVRERLFTRHPLVRSTKSEHVPGEEQRRQAGLLIPDTLAEEPTADID
jgi:hypothetical protein